MRQQIDVNGIDFDPDSDLYPDETYSNRRRTWRCRYQSSVAASAKDLARQVAGRLSALIAGRADAQERVPPPEGMLWWGKLLLDRASVPARIFIVRC